MAFPSRELPELTLQDTPSICLSLWFPMSPLSPLRPPLPLLCWVTDSPTVFLARRKQKKMLSAIALSSLFPSNVFKNKQANKQTTQNSTKQSKKD